MATSEAEPMDRIGATCHNNTMISNLDAQFSTIGIAGCTCSFIEEAFITVSSLLQNQHIT